MCGLDDAAYAAIIGAAISAAGAGAQMAGAEQSKSKANAAVNAELQRQRALQDQAAQVYQQSKNQSTSGEAQTGIKAGQQERLGAYQQAQSLPLSFSQPGTQIGKAVVNARDAATLDLSNRARSALAGYDQWMLQRMIQQQQSGNLLGVTSNLARSSGNVLPMELNSASHAGDSLNGIGGMLGQVGGATMGYGASQGGGGLCGPSNDNATAGFNMLKQQAAFK